MAAKKTYFEYAKEAISSLKERSGSSAQAIKSYIISSYPDVNFQQHLLRAALKKGVAAEKLVQIKASYKLAVAEPKITMPKVVKVVEVKPKKVVVAKVVKPAPNTPTKKAKKKAASAKKATPKKSAGPMPAEEPFLRKNPHGTRTHLGRSLSQVVKAARIAKKSK